MNSTEVAGPCGSPLTEGLGPLVERLLRYSDIRRNDPRENRETLRELIVGELADELQAVRKAQRERCAAWVAARRDGFCEEYGSVDPDTGALEFGRGSHAEAKNEYAFELQEIADGLRALRA